MRSIFASAAGVLVALLLAKPADAHTTISTADGCCVYTLEHQAELAGLICEDFAFQVYAPDFALAVLKGLSHVAPHAHVLGALAGKEECDAIHRLTIPRRCKRSRRGGPPALASGSAERLGLVELGEAKAAGGAGPAFRAARGITTARRRMPTSGRRQTPP